MKWMILPVAVIALTITSCTKESLSTPNATLNASSNSKLDDNGVDDNGHHNGGDDKGGNVNSGGGGTNVSAASLPAAVRSAFKSKYPTASSIEWKKLSNGSYKAEFWFKGFRYQATFSAMGNLLKEEHR